MMNDLTDADKQTLVDELREFVRIPSRSSVTGGEEGALQSLIAGRMREAGARVRTFEADDIPGFRAHPLCHGPNRQYTNRPTVIGEIGPEDAPALLVLAHSDTVQLFEPKAWTVDPFAATMKDGAIYGLGVSDDKWGLATVLLLLRKFAAATPLRKRLIFATTMDEENGVGNGLLLLMLAGVKAEAALYLDGYQMKTFVGCLGGSTYYLRPKSPLPASELANDLGAIQAACHTLSLDRTPLFDRPLYRDNAMRDSSVVAARREDARGPHLIVMFYTLPGEERHAISDVLERLIRETLGNRHAMYEITCREPWFEPAMLPSDTPLIGHLSEAVRATTGREPEVVTISKQDSFVLTNHAGIPTVSFGCMGRVSGRGAMHGPDEFLLLEELWAGARVAYRAVQSWLRA